MILTHDDLIKLIHDTKAVSVWNSQTGPVFWYTAGVPGPFFVNTEYLVGAELAKLLVDQITVILEQTPVAAERATRIKEAVMSAYRTHDLYKNLIDTMVDTAKRHLKDGSYDLVSGGERRDWIFSVPFAEATGLRHVYLFKDQSAYCESPLKSGETTLHIADLINNAASYIDKWIPALEKNNLRLDTTLCVNTRGSVGIKALKDKNVAILALNSVDLPFFEKSWKNGLIDQAKYEELALHYDSAQAWGEKYLIGHADLFQIDRSNAKDIERAKSFFSKDPWDLKAKHPDFFAAMNTALAARDKAG